MFPPPPLLISGVIVLALAPSAISLMLRSIFFTKDVRKYGTSVEATVTRIDAELRPFTRGGHKPSYFVSADWEDPKTHKVYHFKSKAAGARVLVNYRPGSPVEVRIDPRNPKRYAVVLKVDEQENV
jgi:hypothetical protein